MSNTKKLILVVIVFLIIVLVYPIFSPSKTGNFKGSVDSVSNSSVVVNGAYESEISEAKKLYNKKIGVTSSTKIVKTSFFRPQGEGMFNMDQVLKDTTDVDFATLKKDSENVPLGIEVVLAQGFLNKIFPKAIEIKYIGPKY